jgi:arylsulfatase A-like enzyme
MDKLTLSLAVLPVIFSQEAFTQNRDKPLRPNILWVTIEDTSPQFVGCYGDQYAKTPVIDLLAKEGVRFSNAFSTGTVCSPSRTAIITGVKTYQTGTGNHRSKFQVPGFIRGFPYYLQQAGYYTSNNAKTDYNVADEVAFIREAWNESSNKAGWWNRSPGQPFFAVFNFMESHQSKTMTEPYEWYTNQVLNHLSPDEQIGDHEFEMPPFYLDSPEMRKQFARVYNSIALTDKRIGSLLSRLEADNLKDSTIIFFYADHGEGMPRGKTNGINYGYRVPFVIWFPPAYAHLSPWGTSGVVTDELIDFTDLAPTIISLAGGEIPSHLEGRPFLGDRRAAPVGHLCLSSDRSDNGIDMVRTITDGRFIYSRNFMPYINELRYIRYMEIGEIKQQMRQDLKANRLGPLQRSLFEPRPAEFLFDIENDLWETRNLVGDPEYQAILDKMRKLLKEEILRSRDVMFLPEYEIAQIAGSITPYEFRADEDKYPLEDIFKTASLSGFRDSRIAQQQIEWLSGSNPVIRYWSILGLRSQSPETLAPHRAKILQAVDDVYPPVALMASGIAYTNFGDAIAEEKLKTFCLSDNPYLALMAVNSLLYIENRQPFIETIQKTREIYKGQYDVSAACLDFLGSVGLVPNHPDFRD